MLPPATDDVIAAVSSGWEASAVGVLRLSGPECFDLVHSLCAAPVDVATTPTSQRVELTFDGVTLPADVFWFRAPRSYTGQDLVEIHTVGCLPLLRLLAGELTRRGARRALPGEFTARAYLNGKLDAAQADAVQALIAASSDVEARRAARATRVSQSEQLGAIADDLADALARLEAGIDFAEEEDVRFIEPDELRERLEQCIERLRVASGATSGAARSAEPHVAFAGLPNAGKSTLFNELLGYERAIVSPVIGTTRDVLSAETRLNDRRVVLQDCAGLGHTPDELELAAHLAAERAADDADAIVWVHDADNEWTSAELAALSRTPAERVVIVQSKIDRTERRFAPPMAARATVAVSAATGVGLDALREALGALLDEREEVGVALLMDDKIRRSAAALGRAVEALGPEIPSLPEAAALEIRGAIEALEVGRGGPLVEEILGRIYATFCVGK